MVKNNNLNKNEHLQSITVYFGSVKKETHNKGK